MVVSLVSAMMGSIGQNFIVLMAFTLFFITSTGVYVIYKVSPVEQITYDMPEGVTRERRLARTLLLLAPFGAMLGIALGFQFGLLAGLAVFFLLLGLSLVPSGYMAWKDDANVATLDSEFPTFLRSVGNVAGSTGVTLTEGLRRIDVRSMGSLEPHIINLRTRLNANLPTHSCWEKFRQETGSELANRTTHMLVDGSELGGRPDLVGQICSDYASRVTQLRAKRKLTASTFSFLAVPMHATMVFILVFILEIITSFNSRLALASAEVGGKAVGTLEVPENLQLPPGIQLPQGGDLAGGLDIFATQDLTLTSYMIVLVVIILTFANTLAPKFAAGGHHLKLASFFSIMCVTSGVILGVVPILTGKLFPIS